MSDFDASKAAKEELISLSDVLGTLMKRERAAEEAMAIAETELNAIRKLTGFAKIEIERKREMLRRLEEAIAE
ncbi:MAG: hypothetical protein ACREB8_01095 [Pseudolabrys sp.]